MADKITADTSEVRAFADDLGKIGLRATFIAAAVVKDSADALEQTMKELAPYETGTLRDSITTTFHSGLSATVGPTVDYAKYLEFGTAHMEPHPFVGPAADRHEPQFVDAMTRIADI